MQSRGTARGFAQRYMAILSEKLTLFTGKDYLARGGAQHIEGKRGLSGLHRPYPSQPRPYTRGARGRAYRALFLLLRLS